MQAHTNEPGAASPRPAAALPITPQPLGLKRTVALVALLAMGLGLPCLQGVLPTAHPLSSPLLSTAEAKSKGADDSPFASLDPIYKQLHGVIQQLLQKGSLKDPRPFLLGKRFHVQTSRSRKYSKKLAQIANPKLGWLAFEFETTLHDGKLPRLHIRWILGRVKGGWRIAEVRSYSTSRAKGVPADQLKGASLPMAKAAKQLLPWLKDKRCHQMPILTPKDLPISMPKKLTRNMFRGLKRTRNNHRALCKTLSELKFDNMSIYVDDIFGFVTNGKDLLKGGIMLEWRLQSKGELIFKRYRFRPLR